MCSISYVQNIQILILCDRVNGSLYWDSHKLFIHSHIWVDICAVLMDDLVATGEAHYLFNSAKSTHCTLDLPALVCMTNSPDL